MIGEAALIALAAAIYLFDCMVLLERGQALITPGSLSFGSRHYQISGKVVALMNPLTPFIPAFRSLPLFSREPGVKLSDAVRAQAPVSVLGGLQFLLIFIVLPYCLYRAPGWPFVIALLLAYLNAALMLALLVLRFRRYSIPVRPLAALGFGWIACLPLSVNCVRAAGVGVPIALDATRAMRFLGEKQAAREDLAAQVAEAMQEIEEADERHSRLAALASQLKPGDGHGRL